MIQEVRERFLEDRFATENGCEIEAIEDGYACCTMRLEKKHQNAAGTVMGGAVFTLADFTFAVAANWNRPLTVSQSCSISYLGAAKGELLRAEAKIIKDGRTTVYANVDVFDERGKQVAAVVVNGFKK